MTSDGGLLLAIDTSTSLAVVALGDRDGRLLAEDGWLAGFRHGEELLERVDRLLGSRSSSAADIAAIAVGTGPGAFTGLRVGLSTAKGLALALGRPVVGVPSGRVLLEAAREAGVPGRIALLLPAGLSDRILVTEHDAPTSSWMPRTVRLGPGEDPVPGEGRPAADVMATVVAVDLEGRADEAACERGRIAQAALGRTLLRLAASRLAAHGGDDLAELVPEYVTLPRGVARETGEIILGRA